MKHEPNGRAKMPQNLLLPRAELVYLPVTPEVARAVENAVQQTLAAPCPQRRSAAGRAVLHAKGVSLPGVAGMNRGVRCHRPAQLADDPAPASPPAAPETPAVSPDKEQPLPPVSQPTLRRNP